MNSHRNLRTLRDLAGLPTDPTPLKRSTLLVIDAQIAYSHEGALPLPDIEAASARLAELLADARRQSIPVIHVAHVGATGTPFDPIAGRFLACVAPVAGEVVVTKTLPNAFAETTLRERVEELGRPLVICGFMTHMCVASTARAAFDLGWDTNVVGAFISPAASVEHPQCSEVGVMSFSPIALIVFLIPLAYSPGPGNMFFAVNGAALGFRATIPANLGYHAATWVVTLAIGIGLDSGLDRYPTAFITLKTVGAGYVLWIAWKLFRSNVIGNGNQATTSSATDGALLLVLNPKAYVIIALMFTQFLDGSAEHRLATVLLIATIFTVNNMVSFTIWAAIGDRLVRTFRSDRSARRINISLSMMLAAVSVWIIAG